MSGGQSAEWTETDRRYMAAAIRLSLWHRGLTGENPSVGALIVREDGGDPVIVGRGATECGGRPHAELVALREAGEAARGATAYVTLEPCSHIGKAPPCADALVSSGVSRVVIATLDPDKRVAGRGVSILRQAGIEVEAGCLEDDARRAMAGFLALKRRGRPWLTLKMAVSADGMIGRSGAGQVPITGEIARRAVQMMRVEHEAIMVGVGTVVADDPLLNVRLPGLDTRSPTRVIIDPFLRTPPASRMFVDASSNRVLILASAKADRRRLDALKESGADVRTIASDYKGRFDPAEVLRVLGVIGLKSVLLEGGAETARCFLDAGLVDRIALFTGDVQVGTDGIASPINESSIPSGFEAVRTAGYGKDRLIEYERSP